MQKIKWLATDHVDVGPYAIPIAPGLEAGFHQGSGCRRNRPLVRSLKVRLYPLVKLRQDLLVDGFIESEIGLLIRRYVKPDTVFLEVGCGDMSLKRFLPKDVAYNAVDL
ncbi:MAG: hypothetical protein KGJ78_09825 [Alphaproteobacteria bacterium]|nr:hypothetical protein [Alphaproteobacteria bacterium]